MVFVCRRHPDPSSFGVPVRMANFITRIFTTLLIRVLATHTFADCCATINLLVAIGGRFHPNSSWSRGGYSLTFCCCSSNYSGKRFSDSGRESNSKAPCFSTARRYQYCKQMDEARGTGSECRWMRPAASDQRFPRQTVRRE